MERKWVVFIVLTLAGIVFCAAFYTFVSTVPLTDGDRETLFQIAAFNTFSSGNYDGYVTYRELSEHGNFGIGTFHGLDGEMIAVNGVFYKIPFDGKPEQVEPRSKTPYATVTFFEADQTITVSDVTNYSEVKKKLDQILPNDNSIYAIRIKGNFDYAETRSVPMQTKPYPSIAEVIKNQSIFKLKNISASAVGFLFPNSMEGVDYPGYHFHLIDDYKTSGGHLIDFIAKNITIQIDQTKKYTLILP